MADKLDKKQKIKLATAGVMLGAAVAITAFRLMGSQKAPPQDFFYDLSAKQLFTAPKDSMPPIRGIDDEKEDAVLAVVIATDGDPKTISARKIAYFETNTPQLKTVLAARKEAIAKGQAPPGMDRQWLRNQTLVRTPDGEEWHSISSQEGLEVVSVITEPGPNGENPVLCIP